MARTPPLDFVLFGITIGIGLVTHFLPGQAATVAMASTAKVTGGAPAHVGSVTAGTRLDRTRVLHQGDGTVRVELTLQGDRVTGSIPRVPTDVMVVLDKSGSMKGDKIRHAREAAGALIDLLGPDDRFGLVTYDDHARWAIAPEFANSEARRSWLMTVGGVDAAGSTNMSGGLDLALSELDRLRGGNRAARVILISDGLPNRGDSTHEGLVSRGSRAARSEYVLTSVGVGHDFNEFLMSAIADAGTGNYYYVQNGNSLAEVFAHEFTTAARTVASGIEVKVAPGVELISAGGYNIQKAWDGSYRFDVGALYAGQTRSVWLTFRVPTTKPGSLVLPEIAIDWTEDGGAQQVALSNGAVECVVDEKAAMAGVDKDAWERSVLQEQYNDLRTQVSRDIQEGRRGEAEKKLQAYKAEVQTMNTYVGSEAVQGNLAEVDALEDEIGEAFAAPDSGDARNRLSKQQQSEAWQGRRKR